MRIVLRGANFAAALALAGLPAGGCSLLVNLSDTTGGATDAGRAPLDGVSADQGPNRDAYAPGSWCATDAATSFFCDDFDEGALGSRWTEMTLQVAGAAMLSSTNFRSSPHGFEISCPNLTPNTYLLEVLTEAVPTASRLTFSFDIKPLMFPADGRGGVLYLATIAQGPGTPRNAIQLRAGTMLLDLQEQVVLESGQIKAGTGQWESATLLREGAWTRAEIGLDFGGSAPKASLSLDGQSVVTANLDPSWKPQSGVAHLGDWYIPSEPAFQVVYDNVAIDVLP